MRAHCGSSAATFVAVACLILGATHPQATAATTGGLPADEYKVKAAILYNLAKFVEWPADAFAEPATPLALCVLGVDPFGAVLDDSLRGRQVSGRAILTRRVAEAESSCHVLFIASSERKRLAMITEGLGTASVLTVSEEDGFTSLGGVVELVTEGGRVRFHISPAAAERARLRVSARLLDLAAGPRHAGGAR